MGNKISLLEHMDTPIDTLYDIYMGNGPNITCAMCTNSIHMATTTNIDIGDMQENICSKCYKEIRNGYKSDF